ncbi:heavy metal-responsive transcriptional regulator [Blastococcus mobilis]|uniref:DNA-binding transcriptional regulator, MerR family n=1 Tax=Blastococcus mobilis TaxID=1938746 RepID=A0A238ZGQ1_9ACTN|nr:heavy metal-responsive transcriptional regulator [Blastococcus mobilis]SNR82517.1 DNA-binding transcriptional regulator, MerR family [Blastococcus mobilis]
MRIGELAEHAGLTVKTIRFYEQAGVLPEPERRPSGYRDYDDSAVARLRFVKAAQAAGLSLAEIREVIAVRDRNGPPCRHVTDLLNAHAADLDRRIAELTALRDEVRRLRDRADGLDPAGCEDAAVCHVIPTDQASCVQRSADAVAGSPRVERPIGVRR